MSEGPYPNVPALTSPVSGIAGIGAIGAQPRRPDGRRRSPETNRSLDETASENVAVPQAPSLPPPRDPLIEALDRLRATDPEREERAADAAVVRLLRGRQVYGEGLSEDPPPLPPAVD